MKYFTKEWWQEDSPDETVVNEYRKYYESMTSKLPKDLVLLEEKFTLHDANVKSIDNDFNNNTVTFSLSGYDQPLNNEIEYTLKFTGVIKLIQNYTNEYMESELGDLLYWEFEVLKSDIEMRMLFSSSSELTIIFNDFSFEYDEIA